MGETKKQKDKRKEHCRIAREGSLEEKVEMLLKHAKLK